MLPSQHSIWTLKERVPSMVAEEVAWLENEQGAVEDRFIRQWVASWGRCGVWGAGVVNGKPSWVDMLAGLTSIVRNSWEDSMVVHSPALLTSQLPEL